MARERGALALLALLLLAGSADARVATTSHSPATLGVALPLVLAPGSTGETTLGENATSATTSLAVGTRTGAPPTALRILSASDRPQLVHLRLEPTSRTGSATLAFLVEGKVQVTLVAGRVMRAEGAPVALPARGALTVQLAGGAPGAGAAARLDLTIVASPTDEPGQTLRERWTVTG